MIQVCEYGIGYIVLNNRMVRFMVFLFKGNRQLIIFMVKFYYSCVYLVYYNYDYILLYLWLVDLLYL